MIDSVKGFLQVYEDTTGKFAIVKSISYHFCEAYKSMISWIIILKTKLIGKQYFIFSEKVNRICIAFSYNLLILDNRTMSQEPWHPGWGTKTDCVIQLNCGEFCTHASHEQPEHGRTSTTEEQKWFSFQTNYDQ